MRAAYEPPNGTEGAKITLGSGDQSDETFVLRQGEEPVDVPADFEDAIAAHPEITAYE